MPSSRVCDAFMHLTDQHGCKGGRTPGWHEAGWLWFGWGDCLHWTTSCPTELKHSKEPIPQQHWLHSVSTDLLHDIRYCPVATVLLLLVSGGHWRQKHSLAHSPVCRTTERTHKHSMMGFICSWLQPWNLKNECTILQLGQNVGRAAADGEQLQRGRGQQKRPGRRGQDVCHQQEGDVHRYPLQQLKLWSREYYDK